MVIIFWFLVLIFAIGLIVYGVRQDIKSADRHSWRTPEEKEYEDDFLDYMKSNRLAIVGLLQDAADDVSYVPAEEDYEPIDEDHLKKFDASKAKRKQRPSSRATSAVKSKRGRK